MVRAMTQRAASEHVLPPPPLEPTPGPALAVGPTLALLPRLVHPRAGLIARLERIRLHEELGGELWSAVGSVASNEPHGQHSLGASVSLRADVAKVRAIGEALQVYALAMSEPCGVSLPWQMAASWSADPSEFLPLSSRAIATNVPLRWWWVTRVASREVFLLPETCFAGNARGRPGVPTASGSGSACANTPTEAAARALAEGIERDALVTFWLRKGPILDIVPDAVRDEEFQALRAAVERNDLRVVLRNISSDVGLPVVGCFLVSARGPPPFCAMGTGASEDTHEAARRALEEAIQMRARYQGLHAEGKHGSAPFLWWNASAARRAWFLADGISTQPRALPRRPAHDRLVDLTRRIEACGGRAYVVDHTPPDIASLGLSICSASLPGFLPKTRVPKVSRLTQLRLEALSVPTGGPHVPLPFP